MFSETLASRPSQPCTSRHSLSYCSGAKTPAGTFEFPTGYEVLTAKEANKSRTPPMEGIQKVESGLGTTQGAHKPPREFLLRSRSPGWVLSEWSPAVRLTNMGVSLPVAVNSTVRTWLLSISERVQGSFPAAPSKEALWKLGDHESYNSENGAERYGKSLLNGSKILGLQDA